jgi:DHA2 family multidrug resistance protein
MHHAQLIEHISLYDAQTTQYLDQLQKAGLSSAQALGQLNHLVTEQAFMLSTDEIFYVSAIITLGLIVFVWLAKPGKSSDSASTSAAH